MLVPMKGGGGYAQSMTLHDFFGKLAARPSSQNLFRQCVAGLLLSCGLIAVCLVEVGVR
jgi:hypothetical protein